MPTKGQREEAEEEENRLFIEIGKRIRDAREQAGLTGEQLADRLGIGQSSISRWENAHYRITLSTLVKIANALDVSLDELIVGAARKIEKKRPCTLRDTCKFLFLTPPTATGATFSLVDVENLTNSLHRFDCDKFPHIQLTIPLPVVILHDSETGYPTGEVRLNEYGREMAIFANEVLSLNACVRPQLADVYDRQLVNVPNTPLDTFRLENSDNGIPF